MFKRFVLQKKLMRAVALCAVSWVALLSMPASGADDSAGVVKLIVPFPAGGAVDAALRIFADRFGVVAKKRVIVENKPGASGLIGAQAGAAAPGDGNTLSYLHAGQVMNQAIGGKPDVLKQFKGVALLTSTVHVLVVKGDSPYKTQADLVAAIQAAPGKLNFGSGGEGSPTHIMVEMMKIASTKPLEATHVPFKASAEAVMGVLQGNLDFTFAVNSVALEHAKAGKLRILSTSSATRDPDMPEIPTVAEAGLKNYVQESWGGIFVPSATPDAIVNALAQTVREVKTNTDLAVAMRKATGTRVLPVDTPQSVTRHVEAELAMSRELVKRLNLKPN